MDPSSRLQGSTIHVLVEPKNALVKQYKKMFGMNNIPDKVVIDKIKGVLVDDEVVGSVNEPSYGAKILYMDDGELEDPARATCL